jgi:hypothetical protein
MNCSRCMAKLGATQAVFLIAGHELCRVCFGKSRWSTASMITRSCRSCGREMKLPATNRARDCSGSCRARSFGLGAVRR